MSTLKQPVGYTIAATDEKGTRVHLMQYTRSTQLAVLAKVLRVAQREGFQGTALQRIDDLNWSVVPLYAEAPNA